MGSPGFQRTERDGTVVYRGQDPFLATSWAFLVALLGAGAAFVMLDTQGWGPTGAALTTTALLAGIGWASARFELRLQPDGPVYRRRLLGLTLRRWALPAAVRARVMGQGDWADEGPDGRDVGTELVLEGAMLDELWIGGKGDQAHALCAALSADLEARYGGAEEQLGRLGHNVPWVLRLLRWVQHQVAWLRPRVSREGPQLRVELPMVGLERDPGETSFWLVTLILAATGLVAAPLAGWAVWSWVAAAVLTLALGMLLWRAGASVRMERRLGAQAITLTHRRFGMDNWRLEIPKAAWSPAHAWWSAHPTGLVYRGTERLKPDSPVLMERLAFGPVPCALAWPWLQEIQGLLDQR